MKWTPNADNALDATVKPDFSQIESDTAQISVNERFALFFPEKRPFFLEGVELLRTPIQAVYTRTITAPRWGSRLTGKAYGVSYTALLADDAGGGSVVLPGPNDSSLAAQDFGSYVLIARAKRDIGRSFVGVLLTDREARDGHGHNRVLGPDFQWRPFSGDTVTGQWLVSGTQEPLRPDLAPEWRGQSFASHAADVNWSHNTTHLDFNLGYKDLGNGFRSFARVIGQYVSTSRDPSLYLFRVPSRSGTFSGSALLAYKLNWQSVLFVGYGDDRELSERRTLEPASRQFFVKISYAFQR